MRSSADLPQILFGKFLRVPSKMKMKTVADALDQDGDNFLLLRFIAAALVIYGHSPGLTGGSVPTDIFTWLNWGEYSGSIAVGIFFAISGFLVAGSFHRSQRTLDFIWARALRIFPGYAACLILCAFLIGPLFTALPHADYFSRPETADYVLKNLKLAPGLAWDLPGVFLDNPKSTTINGSIWTLPAEVRMYLCVAVMGLLGILKRRWVFNLALGCMFLYGLLWPDQIPFLPIAAWVKFAALFAGGAFFFVNRSWIPVHGGILIAAAALAYLLRHTPVYPFLFALCELFFVFWFAYNTPWRGFNRFGDYSYGIYLWGFPMQQVTAALDGALSAPLNAAISFAAALVLAMGSWHMVEKQALKLKKLPRYLFRREIPMPAEGVA